MDNREPHSPDTPSDAGHRAPENRPVHPGAGKEIGTTGHYSGQEYDSPGQAQWRREQQRRSIGPDGMVQGSGSGTGGGNPGEDYDSDNAGGDGGTRTGSDDDEKTIHSGVPL